MNPFVSRISGNSWVMPISIMSLILGFMISLAWVTNETRTSRRQLLRPGQQERVAAGTLDMQEAYEKVSAEVARLQEENTKLQNAMSNNTAGTKALNDSLQEQKMRAGLTDIEGPGIVVTLRDSKKPDTGIDPQALVIHDQDVLRVVNELWSAGAEAIAVNGHRVTVGTAFRCVGPTILVNDVKIASPIVVQAVGDKKTLVGAMELPGGMLQELRETDEEMVDIEGVEKMKLPAFTGSSPIRLGKVPKEKS